MAARSSATALATDADVVLVGCVKSKRPHAAPAKDLYVSAYFAKMRAYAEATGRPWFILTADPGLVRPDDWLEPDGLCLLDTSSDFRRAWGERIAQQLEHAVGPLVGLTVAIHAGAPYANPVCAALPSRGARVLDELHGLSIGRRLAWYRRQ